MLEEGFKAFVEGPLQKLLRKITNKFYKSLGLGFLVTAILQSSSLISVITISFLSAGLLELYAGIGIIFGANLGTTATAWLVAVFGLKIKVSALAMPMLAFGILFVLQKSKTLKGIGYVLAGLGFFFLGIHYMKQGFDVYQDNINLAAYAMPGFWGLMLYTLIGVLITLILQSSSAAMALILTALATAQITYGNSLALAIGANIGTTITAILGSLSANVAGKRLAGAHFLFNMVTGLIALVFITQLGQLVDYMANETGVSAGNYALKLSIFHTIFNLIGVLVMIPFIRPLVRLLNRIFKEKEETENIELPKYLNESTLAYPQTAYESLLNESKRLFEKATFTIVSHGLNLHRTDIKGEEKLKKVIKKSKKELDIDVEEMYYRKVKTIYSKIIKYATLSQSKFSLSSEAMESFTKIKLANRNMVEIIKDIRGLRNNVNKYMTSDNQYIQKEYDSLRAKVSKVLRAVYITRKDESPEAAHLKRLESLKEKANKSDVLIDGTLDTLIRDQKISSAMATSLVNDSANVASISKKLIETAELLYINSDTLLELDENGNGKINGSRPNSCL